VFVRPASVECQRPSLPRTHAQRLAGRLPNSRLPESSKKLDNRQDTAGSVTTPASSVEKQISVEHKQSVTVPRSNVASLTQDDDHKLQQKKNALRLVIKPHYKSGGFMQYDLLFHHHRHLFAHKSMTMRRSNRTSKTEWDSKAH